MHHDSDDMSYAPPARPARVVAPGEFVLAAAHLDHGHIYGQCNGLIEAGATLKWVYDPDPEKVKAFCATFPEVRVARDLQEILDDAEVRMVSTAAVPSERGPIGCRVMKHGKDYFTDKAPFTTLDQLEEARRVAADTGRKYMVYYCERLHVKSAVTAGNLIAQGAVGRVLQVIGLGPHRLNFMQRPEWFFQRARYGGILCDIGSHQFEQYLHYSGAQDATIASAAVGNFAHPDTPELEDFGEASLIGDNGTSNYVRVDWFTPDGLRTWGDTRTFVLGTEGTLELRKNLDVARDERGDHIYLVDAKGEHHFNVSSDVGFPFFGQLILDCLHRTEHAMTQAHAFKAAELALRAQASARVIAPLPSGFAPRR